MSDYDIGPRDIYRTVWHWKTIIAITTILLAALILGGWQAGWWFAGQNATREAHLIRNGYSNQQTLREQITTQIANVDQITVQIASTHDDSLTAALKAQRAAVAGMVCQDASEVTGDPLPPSQQQWVTGNCRAGVLKPGSRYYQEGTP